MTPQDNGVIGRTRTVASFLRLPLYGWSLALPILGIMTASGTGARGDAVAIGMSLPFQVILAVVNDLADIEVDRGDPRKAGRPLVSGRVRTGTARAVIAGAVVLAFLADPLLLGFDTRRLTALFVAFAGTAAYNVAGKRTPVPPLMDVLQGVGAGAFMYYGAGAAGEPTGRSALVAVAVAVFITFINGVHAGLRDLRSDYAFGARTTPVLLGARPSDHGAPHIPVTLRAYAWVLQTALMTLTLGPFGYDAAHGGLPWPTAILVPGFAAASFASLYLSLHSTSPMPRRYTFAGVQLLSGFGAVSLLAGGRSDGPVAVGVFAVVLLPLSGKRLVRAVGGLHRLVRAG